MTKIYILGGPGSGKTTYARRLAQKTGIPHFDLDKIKWDNAVNGRYNQRRDKAERIRLLNDILTQNSHWICEGVYFKDWIYPVIEQADYVVILKTPVFVRQMRILRRSWRRVRGIEPAKYKETPLTVFKLLRWSQVYEKKYLPLAMEMIRKAGTPYHIVRKRRFK